MDLAGSMSVDVAYQLLKRSYRRRLERCDGDLRGAEPSGTRPRLELHPPPDFQGGKTLRGGQRTAMEKDLGALGVP
jgi:hypothetical protein